MERARRRIIVPFLLPATFVYLLFFIFPVTQALWTSLFDWSGWSEAKKYVGLGNFRELINDSTFIIVTRNTVYLMVFGGIAIFLIAFLFTSVLSSGIRGKRVFRAILFFPNVIAPVVLSVLWAFIYHPRMGLLNSALRSLGLGALIRSWTAPDNIFWALLVPVIWTWAGFFVVMLLAAVERIPESFFDAAKIDGASRFQVFYRVSIPLIWDVLAIALVFWVINALKWFEFHFAFGGWSPSREIWTTAIYVYIMGFGKRDPIFRLGYATAISVVLLIMVIISVLLVRRLMRHETIEY